MLKGKYTDKKGVEKEIEVPDEERQPCEVWTRVMGYHRPESEFNPGKKQEHKDRRHFVEPKNLEQERLGETLK